jgi:U4/U6 small nuclear ribonucleoprotein PRP31
VQLIGNTSNLAAVDAKLRQLLPAATVMVVTMTATTTIGQSLSVEETDMVMEACRVALELDHARDVIVDYVQSRMNIIAPNLSAIVGTTTAAKLMGAAGGLSALSKVPACNLSVRCWEIDCVLMTGDSYWAEVKRYWRGSRVQTPMSARDT